MLFNSFFEGFEKTLKINLTTKAW